MYKDNMLFYPIKKNTLKKNQNFITNIYKEIFIIYRKINFSLYNNIR